MRILITYIALLIMPQAFTQVMNEGNFKIHTNGVVAVHGNFTNDGLMDDNQGTLYFTGNQSQIVGGDSVIHATDIVINKSVQHVSLTTELQVANDMNFMKGNIETDTAQNNSAFVHFLASGSYTGASDSSHVEGTVVKTGNTSFEFPVGDASQLRTLTISSPSTITDQFMCYYSMSDPGSINSDDSLDNNVDHISSCEHWVLNRNSGSSLPKVTLSWDDNSCGVNSLCDLLVARWSGTQWTSEGNGGTTGSSSAGTIVSGSSCSTPADITAFGYFTLGSGNSLNPLPTGLVEFYAERVSRRVKATWSTISEQDIAQFVVQRSEDLNNWSNIDSQNSKGQSTEKLNYTSYDENPHNSVLYYRLKIVGLSGEASFSEIRAVSEIQIMENELTLFPNPANDKITVHYDSDQLMVFNSLGKQMSVNRYKSADGSTILEISHLSPGLYLLTDGILKKVFIMQ